MIHWSEASVIEAKIKDVSENGAFRIPYEWAGGEEGEPEEEPVEAAGEEGEDGLADGEELSPLAVGL